MQLAKNGSVQQKINMLPVFKVVRGDDAIKGILEDVKAKYGEFVPVGLVGKLFGNGHGLPVVNDGVAAVDVAVEISKARTSALRAG
ncbi:MAG: hypothetical protein WCT07_03700 [Candidatus Paceibacterota bacterium]|jgi:hypothetical protein